MKSPYSLLAGLFFLLWCVACHRPYALVQRSPAPRFQPLPQPSEPPTNLDAEPATLPADSRGVASVHPPADEAQSALVTTSPQPNITVALQLTQRRARIERLLNQPVTETSATGQPRPKPKPKTQLRLGNRIRESLGLPLREELSWWQRIDWKLKASVLVILVALIFAIAGVSQLALVFGLVGALLLVLGLKRSFKKRRPWF